MRPLTSNGQLFSPTRFVLSMIDPWYWIPLPRTRSQRAALSFDQSLKCLRCAVQANLCSVGLDCEQLGRLDSIKLFDIAQD
jgi:hypothetical protein